MAGAAALLALLGGCAAQLAVAEPPALAANLSDIDYSLSSFGASLAFGRTLLADLYVPEEGNENGCVALKPFDDRFVYLLLRGRCSYSKKAFLAQLAGATAVVVYHEDAAANVSALLPVSDSIYNNLQIPVLLVNNSAGQAIAESARRGERVRLSITPQVGGRRGDSAEVEFWFDAAHAPSIDFILAFRRVLEGFEGRLAFRPKYRLDSLPALNASALCFGGGAYCVAEPQRAAAESILREVVRQVCLLNLSARDDSNLQSWFDYLAQYRKCLGDALAREDKSLGCFDAVKQSGDIDGALLERVDGCYAASFENAAEPRTSANSVLAEHQRSAHGTRYSLLPAVFINKVLLKEDVELSVVVSGICSDVNNPPQFCKDFFTRKIDWAQGQAKAFGAGKLIGLVLLGVFGASVVCIYCCVRRVARRKINSEIAQFVREHVNEYILENSLKAAGVMSIEEKGLRMP